jgi:ribose transport system substrate-binding protein
VSNIGVRRRKGPLVALALASLSLFVAACGSDDSSPSGASDAGAKPAASGAQAEAKAAVEAAKKLPEFKLEAPKIDLSKVKGKTVFNIPVASTIPYVAEVDKEMKRLAEANGAKFIQYENEGNPTQWAAGFNQAIEQKVDLIVMQAGNDPRLVVPQLKRAKAAGIPVLVSHLYQNGTKPPAEVADLITGIVTVPFWESGRLSVDYAVAESGCENMSVFIVNAKEVPPSQGIVDAMKEQLKKRCPDAKVAEANVPVVDWGTKIRPEVQSAISRDPNLKWVLPIYDSMSLGAEAGIRAAGKSDGSVRIASYNGTPAIMKLIQDGDIMAAEQGENINWLAYANMDQAFRVLGAGPIIEDGNEMTPLRTFDDTNIAEAGEPPVGDKGYGTSYQTGYEALWGIGG